jgi:hypothetical protein
MSIFEILSLTSVCKKPPNWQATHTSLILIIFSKVQTEEFPILCPNTPPPPRHWCSYREASCWTGIFGSVL